MPTSEARVNMMRGSSMPNDKPVRTSSTSRSLLPIPENLRQLSSLPSSASRPRFFKPCNHDSLPMPDDKPDKTSSTRLSLLPIPKHLRQLPSLPSSTSHANNEPKSSKPCSNDSLSNYKIPKRSRAHIQHEEDDPLNSEFYLKQ